MKTNLIITIFTLLALSSCKKTEKRHNEITKITLSTGTCGWFCPHQTIEIDSSLTLRYQGMAFADKKGFYIGKISPELWDSINYRFEKLDYKMLKPDYESKVFDDTSLYIKIDYLKKQKCVRAESLGLPKGLDEACFWLMSLKDSIKLTQTTDTLSFDLKNISYASPILKPLTEEQIKRLEQE